MRPAARRLLRLLLAVLGLGVIAWLIVGRTRANRASSPGGESAAAGRAVPVQVAAVEERDVPVWLEGLGNVTALQQVTVRTQVDGRLDKVFFREGQAVHRGDLLAQIDPRPFLVQLHQAEGALQRDRAQLASARLNLSRYRALVEQKLVSPQQVDDQASTAGQAEGAVQVDLAAVEAARLNLDYARIKAPLDGVVGVRLVDAGNYLRASDTGGLVVLTQLDPAAVVLTLPEDELPRVTAARQKGEVPVEAWSRDGQTRIGKGTLAVVDNQINVATATLRLKAVLPNPDGRLWPNEFVKARLLVDTLGRALVLPAAAIQRGPHNTFVYAVGPDDTVSVRPVEVELTTGELAVIARGRPAGGGVSPGERVVVEGQNQLRPGARVFARPAAGQGAAPAGGRRGGGGTGAAR